LCQLRLMSPYVAKSSGEFTQAIALRSQRSTRLVCFIRKSNQNHVTFSNRGALDTGVETTSINTQTTDHLGLLDAALGYIEQRHWDVALGTEVLRQDGVWSCSCGEAGCAAIGAHPLHRDWQKKISGQPSKAHEWWSAHPRSSIILPTGRVFDVLDVSEEAGCLALARLERSEANIGPVAATPTRRMYFFVLPNSREKLDKVLPGLGWGKTPLDLVCRSAGDYVIAPPSRMGIRGQAQWVRSPSDTNRWLPDIEELLAPLSYACGQHR